MPNEMRPKGMQKVVFYDGECGVCNGLVQFLLERDHAGRLHYAPLQGVTARERLGRTPDLDTMIFARGTQVLERSDAVLAIAAELGGAWKLVSTLRLVPRAIRNWLYDRFAKNRHRVPLATSCRLATPDERKRFLP